MMQSCVRYVLFGATIVAATAAAADSSARRGEEASFSSLVDAGGNITFPAHFPSGYVHIGSWAVAGADGVADTHVVYARPEDVAHYRRSGAFPDGAVIIKEVLEAIGSAHTTGKAFWGAHGKTWFVMVKDVKGRFPANPLWGDGWGGAQFDPKDRSKQIATNYKTDCLQCHVPAKAMDWIYVYAYPALGEKALQFTPEAARSGGLKPDEGHRVKATTSGAQMTDEQPKVAMGKQLFMQTCTACHSATANEHGTGPSLFGVMGRTAGSAPGYQYSDALRNSGVVWSPGNLVKHLADTRGFIPGNLMGRFFKGVAATDERDAIVAYLATLK